MKKVVCARCGLVNLDKFVSFPHCAACGALLPQRKPSRWRKIWRRPVKPIYWMLAVGSGLAMLGLAIASIARETRASGDKPLLVYSRIPREISFGQSATAQFTLDSALENPDDTFERVSLRLSRATQNQFIIAKVQPAPDFIETRGQGRYYGWAKLPRNSIVQLTLAPRSKTTGILQLQATLWAAQYQQFEVRATIETKIGGAVAAPVTTSAAPMQNSSKMAR